MILPGMMVRPMMVRPIIVRPMMTRRTISRQRISQRRNPAAVRSGEGGWILLTLIFMVALLAISLTAVLPEIKQQIIRDQEEEMIHRGAQYTRALRLYYKKNGRYPAKVEDLENTNNIRYLRKRYKDPTVKGEEPGGGEFKILHFGDPSVNLQQGINPQAAALAAAAGAASGLTGGALDRSLRRSEVAAAVAAVQAQQAQQNSGPNQNPPATPGDGSGDTTNPAGTPATTVGAPGATPANADGESNPDQSGNSKLSGGPVLGGGAMVGVASTNENTANLYSPGHASIREFNKKHHYNEWQFIYDPQSDSGALPNGPWQPRTIGATGQSGQIGTPAGQLNGPPTPDAQQPLPAPIRDIRQ